MTLCIYHGNCADGFTAAWVVWKALGENVDFHAGVYQNPPPDVTGRDVIMVDFSYKRDVLIEMVRRARTILILDHHKSAAEDLAGLPLPVGLGPTGPAPADWGFCDVVSGYNPDAMHEAARQCNGPPLYGLFDMERSGAGIAWDFFFPGMSRPKLIDHVEDRDLWRFKLPRTREIQSAVFSFPYDFVTWERIMGLPTEVLAQEGEAIERKHHKDIAELIQVVTRRMMVGGYHVPMANLPYTLTSDAGHRLAQGEPFAGCYWDTPEGRVFSLRSTDAGLDVSSVAAAYGGGGHRNASGFRVAFERLAPDGGPGTPA